MPSKPKNASGRSSSMPWLSRAVLNPAVEKGRHRALVLREQTKSCPTHTQQTKQKYQLSHQISICLLFSLFLIMIVVAIEDNPGDWFSSSTSMSFFIQVCHQLSSHCEFSFKKMDCSHMSPTSHYAVPQDFHSWSEGGLVNFSHGTYISS